MKLFFILLLSGLSLQAATYDCRVEENFSNIEKIKVTATENQRLLVRSDASYTFYLSTFPEAIIELEAFLPSVEMRIYSKGNIEKNSVTLTSWQRDGLLEFKCSLVTE